jgi:hypothetical protein
MSWTYKVKQLLYYFWGTDDNKYVVDHLGRKIIFFDKNFSYKTKTPSTWSYKSKT